MSLTRATPARSIGLWAGWLASAGLVLARLAGSFLGAPTDPRTLSSTVIGSLLVLSLTTTGAVLVTRVPRNRIGGVLYACGLLMAVTYVGSTAEPVAPAIETWLVWLAGLAFMPALAGLGFFLPLIFPSGDLPSPRWRVAVGIAIAAVVVHELSAAFTPYQVGSVPPGIENPLAVGGWVASILGVVSMAAAASVVLFPMVAASLVMRYRRAQGAERAQLRWLAAAVGVIGPCLAVAIAAGNPSGWMAVAGNVAWELAGIGLVLLPVAIGIAVLRYRLYEIDVILNRAAVYASVGVVLAAAFFLADVALQRVVEGFTHERSDVITAGLGVGAGLLFGPMQRRVRPAVDRLLPGRAELALLFNDIVGSTERIVEIGDQRWRVLFAEYLSAVRAELARHGGQEINTAGDAFFATFSRPSDALRAAVAIRGAVGELGLTTRSGLHLGEVEMRGEQVSGLAVHTAARIMAAAGDGEILVSDAMRAAIETPGVSTRDRGRHALKGVPGDWQLFAVDSAG